MGRLVTTVSSLLTISCLAAPATLHAQEGGTDEKPDIELPKVVITGIDESLLGVGETPDLPAVESEAVPLAIPPIGAPAEVTLPDEATRTEFESIAAPDIPPELTVRGYVSAARHQSILAGFEASRQVGPGGLFLELWGRDSNGHIPGAPWSRVGAKAGVILKPTASAGFRAAVNHRVRHQELPRHGFATRDINLVSGGQEAGVQRFTWSDVDLRYRFEGSDGFLTGLILRGEQATLRPEDETSERTLLNGTADVHLEMPLDANLWSLELDLALGGLREEMSDGSDSSRQRIHAGLIGRVSVGNGWNYHMGAVFKRLGDVEVIGPRIRLIHVSPPTRRLWVGVVPHFAEADYLGFLDRMPFSSGDAGLEPERAPVKVEAGIELRPTSDLSVLGETSVRRGAGFAHVERESSDRGFYQLVADTEKRWVSESAAGVDWRLPYAFHLSADYRFQLVEGERVAYVVAHRGSIGMKYTGPFNVGVQWRWIGSQWGSRALSEGKLPAAGVLSASASLEVARQWSVKVTGENLLDRSYREYWEYEAMPRNVEAGVRYAF